MKKSRKSANIKNMAPIICNKLICTLPKKSKGPIKPIAQNNKAEMNDPIITPKTRKISLATHFDYLIRIQELKLSALVQMETK